MTARRVIAVASDFAKLCALMAVFGFIGALLGWRF